MKNKVIVRQCLYRFLKNIKLHILLLPLVFIGISWNTTVMASPEEDTKKGMEAFLQGDAVNAMNFYLKAAEQGYAPAQRQLAGILDRAEDNEQAIFWYQKAVEQNDAEAKYGLGVMYLVGDGVEIDKERGLELIRASAEQNFHIALMNMFHFSEKGQHGLPVDLQQAVFWLEKAAETGNRWAIERLTNAYRLGELGLTPSDEKASFWESKLN